MYIYRIPVMIRVVYLEEDKTFKKREWRTISGTGVDVRFKGEESPSDAAIRAGKFAVDRGQYVTTTARDLEEALQKFSTLEGANTGSSSREEARALWVRPDLPILELPACPHLHRSPLVMNFCEAKRNDGKVVERCILGDGKDPPECCPVRPVLDAAAERFAHRVLVGKRTHRFIPLSIA